MRDLRRDGHFALRCFTGRFLTEITMPKSNEKSSNKIESNLIKVSARVGSLFAKADHEDVLKRYEIGCHVAALKDTSKYGDDAISKVATLIHRDRSSLYRHAAVAETWSLEEFKDLSARSEKERKPLCWSHLELLATVKDGRTRRGLVERCLKESWTVRQLVGEMSAASVGVAIDGETEAGAPPGHSVARGIVKARRN